MQRVSRIHNVFSKLKQREPMFARLKTPFFLLLEDDQEAHLKMLEHSARGRFEIFYVYKTNLNPRICEMTAQHGFGAEVVNLQEMKRAVRIHGKVLLNGIHKTDEELLFAIRNSKVRIIVDCLEEIQRIAELSSGKRVPVGIRISLPGEWHRYGISSKDLPKAFSSDAIMVEGLHVHNGHEKDFSTDRQNMLYLRKIIQKNRKHLTNMKWVDIGGGFFPGGYGRFSQVRSAAKRLGASFLAKPSIRDFDYKDVLGLLNNIHRFFIRYIVPVCPQEPKLYIEPGMLIANPNIYFITKVVSKKAGYIVVDGGTNNLPVMKGKAHIVVNLSTKGDLRRINGPVSGPLPRFCDVVADYYFGDTAQIGDLIAIADAGAYTYSYAHFFVRPVAHFYTIKDGRIRKIG